MLDPGIVDGLERGVVQRPGHIDSADLRPQWATTGDHEKVRLGHEGHRASLLRRLHAVTTGAVRRPGFAPRDAAPGSMHAWCIQDVDWTVNGQFSACYPLTTAESTT